MTHSFQGDAQLWPADLHHQRCRAVSHFATTPGSTRSSRLHMMPWIAVHRRHQNKVQWNRESACKLDWFASWRSEAIIPLSQDPSTGEGDQNFLDPFWAHGHQYSCMSRIKATREAFLHHSSFPFSSSLWQMTGLFQFSDQRHSWRPSDSCSNWMQFGRSCFGIIVVGRPAHSCSKLLDCTLGWTEKDQTAFCRPAAYSGVSMLRYGDPQLVQPISSFDGWNICRCPWSGILCRLAWDLAVEICWNMLKSYWDLSQLKARDTHLLRRCSWDAFACSGMRTTGQSSTGRDGTQFSRPLEAIHVELAHTCHRCGWILTNLTDPNSCWMVLNQRSEMFWLTWLDRASSEAKNCGEKSYWAVASFERWTEPL